MGGFLTVVIGVELDKHNVRNETFLKSRTFCATYRGYG